MKETAPPLSGGAASADNQQSQGIAQSASDTQHPLKICRAPAPPLSACSSIADAVTVTDTAVLPALIEHAQAIRSLGKRVVADVFEIGARLTDCKRICGHGGWLPWLEREFGWDERMAQRFITVHELAGKYDNLSDLSLPISGLYLLAAPSTPEAARNAVLERAESGEILPVKEIKRVVREHKQPAYRPNKRQTEFADASEWGAHKGHFAHEEARDLVRQWKEAEWGYDTREHFLNAILDDAPETIVPGINAWLKKCRPRKRVAFIKNLVAGVEGFQSLRAKRIRRTPRRR
jgi:hypothetical protein